MMNELRKTAEVNGCKQLHAGPLLAGFWPLPETAGHTTSARSTYPAPQIRVHAYQDTLRESYARVQHLERIVDLTSNTTLDHTSATRTHHVRLA